jgi:Acetyltransferase (GNAT) domain
MPHLPESLTLVLGSQLQERSVFDAAKDSDQSACFFTSFRWFLPYFSLWSKDCYGVMPGYGAYFGVARKRGTLGNSYLAIALNESLNPLHESLTLEANGFIGRGSSDFLLSFPAVLENLCVQKDWKELRLAALTSDQVRVVQAAAQSCGLYCLVYRETKSFQFVYPKSLTPNGLDYLSTLSANSRQQLRRARRLLEKQHGEVALEDPTDVEQALEWLDALGVLHAKRWPSTNPVEGFNNPTFLIFHQNMIRTLLSQGTVRLLRLRAGQKKLAYLYFYHLEGTYSFLMSGVDYEDTTPYKPGMLAHWAAIEKFHLEGAVVYDFLNGENRYKESLSNQSYDVKTLLLRRRTLWFSLEQILRALRLRLKN